MQFILLSLFFMIFVPLDVKAQDERIKNLQVEGGAHGQLDRQSMGVWKIIAVKGGVKVKLINETKTWYDIGFPEEFIGKSQKLLTAQVDGPFLNCDRGLLIISTTVPYGEMTNNLFIPNSIDLMKIVKEDNYVTIEQITCKDSGKTFFPFIVTRHDLAYYPAGNTVFVMERQR